VGEAARRNKEEAHLTRQDATYKNQQALLAAGKARRKEEARRNKEASIKGKAAAKKWKEEQARKQQVIDMICAAHDAAPDYILQRIHDDTTELSR
jgi:hypothetical protein